ncbi:MBL fold metallo-hydrolase [Arthrobacter sp. Soil736]|uniref:MBL fold metallo-hydrolase n=1 Tax=Arthrobacter sp. Soil736 TaxID=1736395 RepID=UPI000ADA8B75
MNSFREQDFDTSLGLGGGIEATFLPAGHILGASQILLTVQGTRVQFTGDLGRPNDPLMYPPRHRGAVDVLVTESTYGNRTHPTTNPETELGEIVTRTAKRGGEILIAAFAVGRAETLMLHLCRLRRWKAIRDIPFISTAPWPSTHQSCTSDTRTSIAWSRRSIRKYMV